MADLRRILISRLNWKLEAPQTPRLLKLELASFAGLVDSAPVVTDENIRPILRKWSNLERFTQKKLAATAYWQAASDGYADKASPFWPLWREFFYGSNLVGYAGKKALLVVDRLEAEFLRKYELIPLKLESEEFDSSPETLVGTLINSRFDLVIAHPYSLKMFPALIQAQELGYPVISLENENPLTEEIIQGYQSLRDHGIPACIREGLGFSDRLYCCLADLEKAG